MKNKFVMLIIGLCGALILTQSQAAQDSASSPKNFKGTVTETQHATAKVKKINHDTREVTLQYPDKHMETFVAGPEVRNLDQVKKGDTINLAYTETVSVHDTGPGGVPGREQGVQVQRAPRGEKPSGAITKTTEVDAVVTAIDHANRTVTLKGPEREITVKARSDAQNFDQVQVGDGVHLKYTENLAISVSK